MIVEDIDAPKNDDWNSDLMNGESLNGKNSQHIDSNNDIHETVEMYKNILNQNY